MRPETTNPLTLDEHRQLGAELRCANARMRQLCGLLVDVYGPNNRAAFTFQKLVETMERLRQELETQACRDLGGNASDAFYL